MGSSGSSYDRSRKKRSRKRSKSRRRHDSSSDSSCSYERKKKSKRKKAKKRRRSSDDDSTNGRRHQRSHKRKRKREQYDRRDRYSHQDDQVDTNNTAGAFVTAANDRESNATASASEGTGASIMEPTNAPDAQLSADKPTASKGPMTQSEYQQLHSQIHEVIDPHTGRSRWQRGTGEIVERIVSREQHKNLNAMATRGDGTSFGRDIVRAATKK